MLRGPLLAVALVALVVLLALGRDPASAPLAPSSRSTASGDAGFSPYVAPRAYRWGDCRIRVGPGYDTARAGRGDWRVVGAGQVDCARRHERLGIAVRELRAGDGDAVVAAAAPERAARGAATAFARTAPVCRIAPVARWETQVLVTVDGRSSGWLGGGWSGPRTDGCGPN
jgi:hypothetical protein